MLVFIRRTRIARVIVITRGVDVPEGMSRSISGGITYVANIGRLAGPRSGSARAYNAMGRRILAIDFQISAPVAVAFAAGTATSWLQIKIRVSFLSISQNQSLPFDPNDGPAASDATNRKWWKRLRRRILSRQSVCARCIGTRRERWLLA